MAARGMASPAGNDGDPLASPEAIARDRGPLRQMVAKLAWALRTH